MTNTQTLVERRVNIWSLMQEIADRPKDPTSGLTTAENATAYDTAEADLDALEAEIARADAHTAREALLNKVDRTGVVPGNGPLDHENGHEQAYSQAFTQWMRGGMNALDGKQTKMLHDRKVEVSNAAGIATGGAGGYTVPPAFRNKIVEQQVFYAVMRQFAEVINTDSGANLPWPTADDSANEGAILAENTQVAEQDVTFGTASLDAYMYTSKLIRVSLQLLQDTGFDLEAWLAKTLATRIARIQNRHFTVGTGTAQPDGIITGAAVGKTGAAAQLTSVIYDDLVDLIDSLDPAYLGGGNLRFMMAQGTRKSLRKLKDTQGRPLWEPSLQVGQPDNLLGYPLVLNNYVPTMAASAKSVLFGDIKEAYVIRDVADFQLMRLAERYADFLQVGFLGFQRSDGTVQNANAAKTFQHAAS